MAKQDLISVSCLFQDKWDSICSQSESSAWCWLKKLNRGLKLFCVIEISDDKWWKTREQYIKRKRGKRINVTCYGSFPPGLWIIALRHRDKRCMSRNNPKKIPTLSFYGNILPLTYKTCPAWMRSLLENIVTLCPISHSRFKLGFTFRLSSSGSLGNNLTH